MVDISNTQSSHNARLSLLYCAVFVISLGLLANFTATQNDFLFDDTLIIEKNPLVVGQIDVAKIFVSNYWFQASEKDPLYRPITILSFALQNSFSVITPWSVMLVNILLCIASALAICLILLRLGFSLQLSVIAGMIFVSMPLHVEVVANGVGRAELLAACFALFSIERFFALVRARNLDGSNSTAKPRLGLIISTTLYLLGLLSKESALSTPLLLFVLDQLYCKEGSVKSRLPDLTYYLFIVVIGLTFYLGLRHTVVGLDTPAAHELLRNASLENRLVLGTKTVLKYLQQCLLPLGLVADYHDFRELTLPGFNSIDSTLAILTLMSIAIASLLALFTNATIVFVCFFWFFVAILPTSNLIIPIGVIQADRLMFFPSVGVAVLLAWIFYSLLKSHPFAGKLSLISFLCLQTFYSIDYTSKWQNKESLWSHVLTHNPGSADAWRNVGDIKFENRNYREAITAYTTSKQLREQHGIFDRAATLLLAKSYHRLGKLEKAAEFHMQVLRRNPEHVVSAISLGQLYLENPKYYKDALRVFRFVVARHPKNPHALAHLAEALKRLGQYDEALVQANLALGISSDWPYILLIKADTLEQLGRLKQAEELRLQARNLSKK